MDTRTTQRHPLATTAWPRLLTVSFVAQELQLSRRTIRRWIEEQRISAIRTSPSGSGRLLIDRESLIAALGLGAADA